MILLELVKVVFQNQGLITETYRNFYRNQLPEDVELVFTNNRDPNTFLDEIEDMDIYVGFSLTRELLERAKKLKHIQFPWTGINSLNINFLKDYKGTISNSHSNSLAIAEHAFALLTSAAKLITYRDSGMRRFDWSSRRQDVNSTWLTRKTLGVIGYGAIGKKVAKMAKFGFDMQVMGIKRKKTENEEFADFIGDFNDLEKVLLEADYILISLPLTPQTEGIIAEKQFAVMKPTTVIINIARGAVIDEKSLYTALSEKKIAAAGIDVWYNYPKSGEVETKQNYPFEDLKNIVMTPHSAFKVRDRVEIFAKDILENIQRVHKGLDPINQVDLLHGY